MCAQRRSILAETIRAFEDASPPDRFQAQAQRNLTRWQAERARAAARRDVVVLRGDWGDAALAMTKAHGAIFAVLNMANAYVPGGAYVEGAPAQEENLFRRSNCHFAMDSEQMGPLERYIPSMTALLNGETGRVYLDTEQPRVCVRGPEDSTAADLGYRWLADDEIFAFYELRAAARDYRDGERFDERDARSRIRAQLDTLIDGGVRHAVLSAFGCGAFRNPAREIARLYRESIEERRGEFACIAFAIHDPGYGPDNFTPFQAQLG
jgi:hypothetical protein